VSLASIENTEPEVHAFATMRASRQSAQMLYLQEIVIVSLDQLMVGRLVGVGQIIDLDAVVSGLAGRHELLERQLLVADQYAGTWVARGLACLDAHGSSLCEPHQLGDDVPDGTARQWAAMDGS
jgi:hypothetical protein